MSHEIFIQKIFDQTMEDNVAPHHILSSHYFLVSKNQKDLKIIPGKNLKVIFGEREIKDVVEKPSVKSAPSNKAVIGRYILPKTIFSKLLKQKPGKGGEIQITDALMKQAQDGCVIAYKFKGKRFDCGGAEGYIDAANFCYEHFYKTGKAY